MLGRRTLAWSLAISVVLSLCAAWFSGCYFHPDEHFQILEFANWRCGASSINDLPWEFQRCARPALQVACVSLVRSTLALVGVADPFVEVRIVRIITALFSLFAALVVARFALRYIGVGRGGRWLFFLSNFAWFVPFLHCRFSAENSSGVLFALGAITWLNIFQKPSSRSVNIMAFVAGILLGLAFICRVQIGLAIGGLAAWNILINRPSLRGALLSTLGFAIALAGGLLIDHWFYGRWVITLFNYLKVNIVEGAANGFGMSPWWYYFSQYFRILIPPFSLLVYGALIFACMRAWRNPLVWISVMFVAGHSIVAHKEIRFLVPMLYIVPTVFIIGLQQMPLLWRRWCDNHRVTRLVVQSYLIFNMLPLIVFSFTPPRKNIVLYRWLYRQSQTSQLHLSTFDDTPYKMGSLNVNYYRAPNVIVDTLPSAAALKTLVDSSSSTVYLFVRALNPPDSVAKIGITYTLKVRTLPPWLLQLNIGNWVDRVRVWSIYQCSTPQTR
jgi:phosphatidylinositol glycan class B